VATSASKQAPRLPELDGASAEEILGWAIPEFFPDVTVACSMQDGVLVDLAAKIEPRIEVFFLETGFHFPQTLETAKRMKDRYSLELVSLRPIENPAVYDKEGYDACCASRKVLPLEAYLADKKAWITGIRWAESATRSGSKAVEWDESRGIVKINPIVAWTDEQVADYIFRHDIIVNPLRNQGYESIGCWPCTKPGSSREGRWSGDEKTECGLHIGRSPR